MVLILKFDLLKDPLSTEKLLLADNRLDKEIVDCRISLFKLFFSNLSIHQCSVTDQAAEATVTDSNLIFT